MDITTIAREDLADLSHFCNENIEYDQFTPELIEDKSFGDPHFDPENVLVGKEENKMGTVELIPDKCLAYLEKECVVCYEMCPVPDAITLTRDLTPTFDDAKCVGCGTCVHSCPAEPNALHLRSEGARRTVA